MRKNNRSLKLLTYRGILTIGGIKTIINKNVILVIILLLSCPLWTWKINSQKTTTHWKRDKRT